MPTFGNNVNLSGHQLLNVVIQVLSAAPSSPAAGRLYFDSTLDMLRYYDGTTWVSLGASATDALTLQGQNGAYYLNRSNHSGTQLAATISDLATAVQAYRLNQFATPNAPLDINSQRLTNVADPTNAQDAATRAFVLAQIANLVDTAPGVLDTLNELAAALGDDPNFATTVATQITDAKNRANHTGTQAASTISDFGTAVDRSGWRSSLSTIADQLAAQQPERSAVVATNADPSIQYLSPLQEDRRRPHHSPTSWLRSSLSGRRWSLRTRIHPSST